MNFIDVSRYYTLFMAIIVAAGGVILGVIFALSGDHPKEAIIGAFVTYSLLDTVFAMRLKKTRKFMPAGLILIFCFIGQVISAVAFVNTPV